MLIENRKIEEGSIVSFKLSSGEELVCKFVKENQDTFTVSKPLMLAMTQQGMGMAPYMMTVDPDNSFDIRKTSVTSHALTIKSLADQYITQTSGIEIAKTMV